MANATFAKLFGNELKLHYAASNANSLFTDVGGTSSAADGNAIKCWKPQTDAKFVVNLTEATNGPTYRSNYQSSGYPALEFDGINDVLVVAASGITTNARMSVLMSCTWIGASNTAWCRGNGASWCRGLVSTTASVLQDSAVGSLTTATKPVGKRVTAWVAGANQSQVDTLGQSAGDLNNHMPSGASAHFTVGALNTGTFSQFGNFALHELLVLGSTIEWGQLLRGATLLRSLWGITDPNPIPQSATGGFPLSRSVN